MIPNIFISSTLADLHYLRDTIRDAIIELRYRPVMSEHGEIGYIKPTTAASSCYHAVEQCHLMILIVGKRYGSLDSERLSVTHKEYLAAKDANIPTITLVEQQVMHYKEVYDASATADIWSAFNLMDHPHSTFALLKDINMSDVFNGLVTFTSAADAKEKLKLQIAHFVGERLGDTIAPMSKQIKDILAEIKTLRNQAAHGTGTTEETKKYLAATRYLLNDTVAEYRSLLDRIFGDLDIAISKICSLADFDGVAKSAGYSLEVVDDASMGMENMAELHAAAPADPARGQALSGQFGYGGGYMVYNNHVIRLSRSYYARFMAQQSVLYSKSQVN
jgi:hypothetical protein